MQNRFLSLSDSVNCAVWSRVWLLSGYWRAAAVLSISATIALQPAQNSRHPGSMWMGAGSKPGPRSSGVNVYGTPATT